MSEAVLKEVQELATVLIAKTEEADTFMSGLQKRLDAQDMKIDKAELKAANENAQAIRGLADRVVGVEQQLADDVIRGVEDPKTLGQLLVMSEGYKNYIQAGGGDVPLIKVEIKNTITGEGAGHIPDSAVVPPHRQSGIIPGLAEPLTVEAVFPSDITHSNSIQVSRERNFTNRAAEVGEGRPMGQTDITVEEVTFPVRTLGHTILVSTQVVEDAPQLVNYVDGRLRYGLNRRVNAQLLIGNGTGVNLSGIMKSGNHTVYTPAAGDGPIESVNKASEELSVTDRAPTVLLMSNRDWGNIERTKTPAGEYVIGNPVGGLPSPMLWGIPVVRSPFMPEGKFAVSDIKDAATLWNRREATVELSRSDGDNFKRNLVTLRATRRLALETHTPAAIVAGDLVVSTSSG